MTYRPPLIQAKAVLAKAEHPEPTTQSSRAKCLNEEQDLTDKMPLDLAPPKIPNTVRVVSANKQKTQLRSPMPSALKLLSERSSRFDKSSVTKAEPKFRLEESWNFEH